MSKRRDKMLRTFSQGLAQAHSPVLFKTLKRVWRGIPHPDRKQGEVALYLTLDRIKTPISADPTRRRSVTGVSAANRSMSAERFFGESYRKKIARQRKRFASKR